MIAGFAVAVAGLHLVGRGPLAAPPLGSTADVRVWVTERTPVGSVLALVRLAGLAVATRVLITALLAAVARLRARRLAVHLIARITFPPLRRLVGATAGMGIGAATAAASGAVAVVVTDSAGPVAAEPAPDAGPPATATLAHLPDAGTATLAHLPDAGTATLVQLDGAPDPRSPAGPDGRSGSQPTLPGEGRRHRVIAGDHLWALALAELTTPSAPGRPTHHPDQRAVDDYWQRVVRANPQLIDPDLLFPGDHVTLPPVPAN